MYGRHGRYDKRVSDNGVVFSSSSASVKSSKGSSSSSEVKAFTKLNSNSGEGGKTWKLLGSVGT